jgi:hypothetical protein
MESPASGSPAPPTPATAARPRVVVLSHRPLTAAYHGSSILLRAFVERLAKSVPLAVVSPNERHGRASGNDAPVDPLMTGFRYLVASSLAALREFLRDSARHRGERFRVVVCFDIYLVWLGALWSRLRGVPLVYYAQDSTDEVSRRWRDAGYRGGRLFRLTRLPLERIALADARLVVVPSDSMRSAFESLGVPAARIRVCRLKRSSPTFDAAAVADWRRRLNLDGRLALVFVGSFQYTPNIRAFEFLRDTVAPDLLRRDPALSVIVAGLDSEPFVGTGPPNVKVLGTVADLDGLLFACRIGVAPMDVGGGTSTKIVDYLLHGLHVLATPEAASGIEPTPYVVVARREEFAQGILRLSDQLRSQPAPPPNNGGPPEFLRRYLESDDIDALGGELRRWSAR